MEIWVATPYLNNTNLPATPGLMGDWKPPDDSIDRFRLPYRHGDKLWRSDHGIEVRTDPLPAGVNREEFAERLCSQLFQKLNADDRPNGRIERSLSIGDVVAVSTRSGTSYFSCQHVGWEPISPPTAENILN